MTHREELINIVISDKSFKQTCCNVSRQYADDIFQEVCEQILTSKQEKLPPCSELKFWFWRVASNVFRKKGKLGKYLNREERENYPIGERLHNEYASYDGYLNPDELINGGRVTHGKVVRVPENDLAIDHSDDDLRKVERVMVGMTEFENRVLLLYMQYGNMKKVERETGISYSALRLVKDKIRGIHETL